MAEEGHEERFRLLSLDVRCVIRQGTFAGTNGNARDAPISAVRETAIAMWRRTSDVGLTGEMRRNRPSDRAAPLSLHAFP